MQATIVLTVTINTDGTEQRPAMEAIAARGAIKLLEAAHKVPGYFGATVKVGVPE